MRPEHLLPMASSAGRPATVRLLDDREINISIQPRLLGSELAAIVGSHCQLKAPDSRLFGLTWIDDKLDDD